MASNNNNNNNIGASSVAQQEQAAVCCGCFGGSPKADDDAGAAGTPPPPTSRKSNSVQRSSVYLDATGHGFGVAKSFEEEDLAFFDAQEDELEEDEYPIITTNYVPKSQRRVSIAEPETMLRIKDEEEEEELQLSPPEPPSSPKKSVRRSSIAEVFRRRKTIDARKDLEQPRVKIMERGYPGELNIHELNECQKFYREISRRQGSFHEIVYSLKDVEEEPYALCRFMRATKFDADKMLERLEVMVPLWEDAKAKKFFPDLEAHFQCSVSLFLQLYPFVYHGNAKNGCPVNYFKAGKIQTEGLFCVTTIENARGFFFNMFVHVFTPSIVRAKKKDPNFVRCESINVLDLSGLSSSQITSDALQVMKNVGKIGDMFPETLHCMIILNAPGWFSMTWSVIKAFLDPRTVKKIEVYSNSARGQKRLLEMIDAAEVPSDYGGADTSTETLMQQAGQTSGKKSRVISNVVFVKNSGTKTVKDFVELKAGETLAIKVYTRSISGASISVSSRSKSVVAGVRVARADTTIFSEENLPTPFITQVCKEVTGPGKFSVEVEGLADAGNVSKKLARGYFLVVADIQTV